MAGLPALTDYAPAEGPTAPPTPVVEAHRRIQLLEAMAMYLTLLEALPDWTSSVLQHCEAWAALMDLELVERELLKLAS